MIQGSAKVQWVTDGPELPVEVLESLEDGNLVLFCGAGISVRAGLPTFRRLVKSVYDSFPDTSPEIEELIFKSQYDRAFYALETLFGRHIVVRKVRELLQLAPDADLSTHRALLKLATGKDGKLRLITTNFDLAFEPEGSAIPTHRAPSLPIAKRERWNSLVYLHGRLNASDPDSENLVLSSADFGLAYLTERWASRFITELFRRFTVLFIGYSADDPVMRYMLDAFAADRAISEPVATAFAFAGAEPEEFKKVAAEWNSKQVQPILYKVEGRNHDRLHSTIQHWANRHSLRLQGKAAVILEHAHTPAIELARQQVCWALRDETGHAAKIFANLDPPAPFEWLEPIEKAGLLSLGHDAFLRETGFVRVLCSSSPPSDRRLHVISAYLIDWLTKHLNDRRFVDWTIEHGTYLHEDLRIRIRCRLAQEVLATVLPRGLYRFWEIVSSEEYASSLRSLGTHFSFDLQRRLHDGEWNSILRHEIVAALTPLLRLQRSWPGLVEPIPQEHLSAYANGELVLRADQGALYVYQELMSRDDRDRVLVDLSFDISSLLDRACA